MGSDSLFHQVVMMMHKLICAAIAAAAFVLSTSAPAVAQIDLSGSWANRPYGDSLANNPGPGPAPVEFMGLPLNESGRARALALSYNAQISSNDRLCAPYSSVYMMLGPQGFKMWNETDPRTGATSAWKISFGGVLVPITIWMDGRPHPSKNALHSEPGFTTGVWEDDVLTTHTTHLKASIIRRNGAPHSNLVTMKTRFARHGDLLTVTARIEDPAYLETAYYLTKVYQLTGGPPIRIGGPPCPGGSEGVPEGTVRHYLPGQNPFMNEIPTRYGIPLAAVLGGPETMYPEYHKQLRGAYVRPAVCDTPNVRARDAGRSGCGGPGTYPRLPR
jgi:hypothetical protein